MRNAFEHYLPEYLRVVRHSCLLLASFRNQLQKELAHEVIRVQLLFCKNLLTDFEKSGS